MKISLRSSALVVITLLACNEATLPGQDTSIVVGSWEWTTACCSIAGQERNPSTEGYTYVLQYSPEGTVEVVRNGDLILTTHFTITRSKPDPLADQITIIEYATPLPHGPAIPSAAKQMVFKTENGTLVLRNTQCADCYGEWRLLPRLTMGG